MTLVQTNVPVAVPAPRLDTAAALPTRTTSRTPATRRSRADLVALVRFVVAGCGGNAVYSLVFLCLAQTSEAVTVPSIVASVVSTLAVNEAHRRWTFRGIGRPSLREAHLSGAASAVVGTALTALALVVWSWLSPEASLTSDVAISWAVTGLVGAANFLHLRRASSRAVTGLVHSGRER